MLYRKGQLSDIPAMIEIGRGFWHQTSYHKAGMEYSEDRCENIAKTCIETGITIVAETDGYIHGMMLCLVHPGIFTDDLMCSDIAFYVSPEGRKKGVGRTLLTLLKSIADLKGCKAIAMISLQSVTPDKSQALFESEGYHHAESTYLLVS